MVDIEKDIRLKMFEFLDQLVLAHPEGAISSSEINTFFFDGKQITLIVQPGIRKPAFLEAALTIRTTYTSPNSRPPYEDSMDKSGLIRYKYRGTNPLHADNRALRAAMELELPLAYFMGIAPGIYHPYFPVYIVGEDVSKLEFMIAIGETQTLSDTANTINIQRKYELHMSKIRLHQSFFRSRVLFAYKNQCTVCKLKLPELLDAAHIIPDSMPDGDPIVPNGLAMCKIHHAAYDRNILGITPDLVIEISKKVLSEIDGPMLKHGIQEMQGKKIHPPTSRASRPDPQRLERKYETFLESA